MADICVGLSVCSFSGRASVQSYLLEQFILLWYRSNYSKFFSLLIRIVLSRSENHDAGNNGKVETTCVAGVEYEDSQQLWTTV